MNQSKAGMEITHDNKPKIDLIAFILILSVSAVIAYEYISRVDIPNFESRFELHKQIIEGTAPSPYCYRILVPFITEVFSMVFSLVLSKKIAFLLSYAIYDLLAIFFLLMILFLWLRYWFSREQALIGILFVSGTIPITFQNHFFQPWTLLEVGLFSSALIAIYSKRYWLLVSIIVLASLNRETALFIPLTFLLASFNIKTFLTIKKKIDWKPILLFCAFFLIWITFFLVLRYFRGNALHIKTIKGLLTQNMTRSSLSYTFVNGSLFFGGFWFFTVFGFKYAPDFIRQVALIIPLYIITIIVWGVWYEVRLLMPLYPIFVPLGLSFIYRQQLKSNSF